MFLIHLIFIILYYLHKCLCNDITDILQMTVNYDNGFPLSYKCGNVMVIQEDMPYNIRIHAGNKYLYYTGCTTGDKTLVFSAENSNPNSNTYLVRMAEIQSSKGEYACGFLTDKYSCCGCDTQPNCFFVNGSCFNYYTCKLMINVIHTITLNVYDSTRTRLLAKAKNNEIVVFQYEPEQNLILDCVKDDTKMKSGTILITNYLGTGKYYNIIQTSQNYSVTHFFSQAISRNRLYLNHSICSYKTSDGITFSAQVNFLPKAGKVVSSTPAPLPAVDNCEQPAVTTTNMCTVTSSSTKGTITDTTTVRSPRPTVDNMTSPPTLSTITTIAPIVTLRTSVGMTKWLFIAIGVIASVIIGLTLYYKLKARKHADALKRIKNRPAQALPPQYQTERPLYYVDYEDEASGQIYSEVYEH